MDIDLNVCGRMKICDMKPGTPFILDDGKILMVMTPDNPNPLYPSTTTSAINLKDGTRWSFSNEAVGTTIKCLGFEPEVIKTDDTLNSNIQAGFNPIWWPEAEKALTHYGKLRLNKVRSIMADHYFLELISEEFMITSLKTKPPRQACICTCKYDIVNKVVSEFEGIMKY